MIKYRVSKYNPILLASNNTYIQTWTSYSDIGKIYNNKKVSYEEYIDIENNYICVLMIILNAIGVSKMNIKGLETNFTISEINRMFENKLPMLTRTHIKILKTLKNDYSIDYAQIGEYIRLILRECFWCQLYDEKTETTIESGYDYYMYVDCLMIPKHIIDIGCKIGIYIEKV